MTAKVRLLFVLALLVIAAGCPKGKQAQSGILTGKLTFNDQPITLGNITFNSTGDEGSIRGEINPDGTYEAAGVPLGDVVVTVDTESFNPATKNKEYGAERGKAFKLSAPKEGMKESTGTYIKIPPKYANRETSTLKITVEAGKKVKDINLTD